MRQIVVAVVLGALLVCSTTQGRSLKQTVTSSLANQASQALTQTVSAGTGLFGQTGAPVPAPEEALAPELAAAQAPAYGRKLLQQTSDTDSDADTDATDLGAGAPQVAVQFAPVPAPGPLYAAVQQIAAALAPQTSESDDGNESSGTRRLMQDDGSGYGISESEDVIETEPVLVPVPAPGPDLLVDLAAGLAPSVEEDVVSDTAGSRRRLSQSLDSETELDDDTSLEFVPVPAPGPYDIEDIIAVIAPEEEEPDDGSRRRLSQSGGEEEDDDAVVVAVVGELVPAPAPGPLELIVEGIVAVIAPEAEGGAGFTRRRLNQADVSDGETDEAESDDGSSVDFVPAPAPGPYDIEEIIAVIAPEEEETDDGSRRRLSQSDAEEEDDDAVVVAVVGELVPAPAPGPLELIVEGIVAVIAPEADETDDGSGSSRRRLSQSAGEEKDDDAVVVAVVGEFVPAPAPGPDDLIIEGIVAVIAPEAEETDDGSGSSRRRLSQSDGEEEDDDAVVVAVVGELVPAPAPGPQELDVEGIIAVIAPEADESDDGGSRRRLRQSAGAESSAAEGAADSIISSGDISETILQQAVPVPAPALGPGVQINPALAPEIEDDSTSD